MSHQGDLCRKFAAKNVSSLHQNMSILVSQVHMMAGQNKCKEKVPDVSDPNQNVETTNSSLHNLKIYSSKGCRKTSQR